MQNAAAQRQHFALLGFEGARVLRGLFRNGSYEFISKQNFIASIAIPAIADRLHSPTSWIGVMQVGDNPANFRVQTAAERG